MKTPELLNSVFGQGSAISAPVQEPMAPIEPEKPKKDPDLSPFVALKAQKTYASPMDTQTGGAPGPVQGGTADALGTGGSWGKPK